MAKMFVTKGIGFGKEDKNAFDRASMQGGFGRLNIINVSSILEPNIEEIDLERFKQLVSDGKKITAIHGVTKTNVPGQLCTSALAYVTNILHPEQTGYVAELFETPGIRADYIKERVERSVMQIFIDENNLPSDYVNENYKPNNANVNYYEVNEFIKLRVTSIIAETVGPMNGDYATAIVAVFLLD
jgi:pyruvoyl-dependent arginine decarboxylase (PvlArgDC)